MLVGVSTILILPAICHYEVNVSFFVKIFILKSNCINFVATKNRHFLEKNCIFWIILHILTTHLTRSFGLWPKCHITQIVVMQLMIIMIIEIMYTCHLFPSIYLSAKLIIIISVTLGYLAKIGPINRAKLFINHFCWYQLFRWEICKVAVRTSIGMRWRVNMR